MEETTMGCGGCRQGVTIQISDPNVIKAPVMNSDGSIQYPKNQKVPVIQGYEQDPKDYSRLITQNSCGCTWRITGLLLNKEGTHLPHHVCRHSKCEHRSKPVTMDICQTCPLKETE